jgi:hypothetical protein
MNGCMYHRGVGLSVTEIEPEIWRWTTYPPKSVLGYAPQFGTIKGSHSAAVEAAKKRIDVQDLQAMNSERFVKKLRIRRGARPHAGQDTEQ